MSELEKQVSQAIEAARIEQGLRPEAICVAGEMSRANYYNRIKGGGWRLAELERIAVLLKKSVVELVSAGYGSAWTRTSLALAA